MGSLDGKVAFITGAARGQGRSHAVHLAEQGAAIVAVDVCRDQPTIKYHMASEDDLNHTAKLVEEVGGKILTWTADVRDLKALQEAAQAAVDTFGSIDIVVANAGVLSFAKTWEMTEEQWSEMIGINLDGVWKTVRATVPHMIAANRGGSIILTSSTNGKKGYGNMSHYTAAKHGVVGLCKSLAVELSPYMIRVNTVNPTTVNTDMALNESTYRVFMPDEDNPTEQQIKDGFQSINMLPIPWIEPSDVSGAVVYLASDAARYVTASSMYVDAGTTER